MYEWPTFHLPPLNLYNYPEWRYFMGDDYLSEFTESLRIAEQRKKESLCKLVTPVDSNVESIREELLHRSEMGFSKYGTTTDRTDIDLYGWLQHLKEELMDSIVYINRIQKELKNDSDT